MQEVFSEIRLKFSRKGLSNLLLKYFLEKIKYIIRNNRN